MIKTRSVNKEKTVARQDMVKLVQRLNLSKEDMIIDMGAGDGAQIKQLRDMGYSYSLGVDLVGNLPLVEPGDMENFITQKFARPVILVSFRYSLHTLNYSSIRKIFIDVCETLKEKGYLYIVTFAENDPIISCGMSVDRLISLIPEQMQVIKVNNDIQQDEYPYPHEHKIIRALFQKKKEEE